jgi:nucleoside-diphosphate-sugar epimerase
MHFVRHALAAGHEVTPLSANLTDKLAVAHEVANAAPDVLVHLAAISFVGHADDAAFYAVNVVGTVNLLGQWLHRRDACGAHWSPAAPTCMATPSFPPSLKARHPRL